MSHLLPIWCILSLHLLNIPTNDYCLWLVWQAKVVDQGVGVGGWGDASWPGITTDLKPPSTATWNSPTDLNQMMINSKKVRQD